MKYYSDGFTIKGNPSLLGGGFSVVDEHNTLIVRHNVLKEGFTNNEGELLGVLYILEKCEKGDLISTDSMNTIYWIRSGYSKARPDLIEVIQKAKKLKKDKNVEIIFETREKNLAGVYNEEHPFSYTI